MQHALRLAAAALAAATAFPSLAKAPAKVNQQAKDIARQGVGYTPAQLKAIQEVANKHNARIQMRPTTSNAVNLRKVGHPPKPEWIKMKTGNRTDELLGGPKNALGMVLYFNPKKPSAQQIQQSGIAAKDVNERYAQRRDEYGANKKEVEKLLKERKIRLSNGIVIDTRTNKAFTGDHDIYAILSAATGRPLALSTQEQIKRELKAKGVDVEHGAHRAWDIKAITDPKKRAQAEEIDRRIRDGHKPVKADGKPGEKLIEASPKGLEQKYDRSKNPNAKPAKGQKPPAKGQKAPPKGQQKPPAKPAPKKAA